MMLNRYYAGKNSFLILSIELLFAVVIFAAVSSAPYRGIILNEICSSNLHEVVDGDGNHPDWIEIRNTSDEDIDLQGYSIYTNNNKEESLIIGDASLPADGYAMIFVPFGISSKGETVYLENDQGEIINAVYVPEMTYDMSYSRQNDGRWIRTEITPEYENSTELKSIATLKPPEFSRESGIYGAPFMLRLSCGLGGHIYYTTDGSMPNENSLEYSDPILIEDVSDRPNIYSDIRSIALNYDPPAYNVDKANVIRAVVKNRVGEYSDVITMVYFVWENEKEEYLGKSIVSLVCDPEDLFSDDRGIYVMGDSFDDDDPEWTGNYFQDGFESERVSDMCVFDEEHNYSFSQRVGIRIKGHHSRSYPQKSFNIIARGAYEEGYIKKKLFDDVEVMKSFSLYSCAQDTDAKLKDALASRLLKNANYETMEMKPAFLFLNGEYWGIYYITERYDSTYIETHKGVNQEDVVMIKDPYEPQDDEAMDLFNMMSDHVRLSDMSVESKYDEFCNMADEDSMVDYYATMFYIARLDDWPGYNEMFWRSRLDDDPRFSKWRPMLYDVNSGCMDISCVDNDTIQAAMETGENKIQGLMQNRRFRNKICDKIKDLSINEFEPGRVRNVIYDIKQDMEKPMEGYYKRWYKNGIPESENISDEADDICAFFEQRGDYIIDIANHYRDNPPVIE